MSRLQIGDAVRIVSGSSQWQGRCGTIVDIVMRSCGDGDATVQECVVSLNGERRWFMAEHLTKSIPTKIVRFFRAEAIERWKLDPDQVICLDGSSDQLISFLRDHCDFSTRRATAEVSDFLCAFNERLKLATASLPWAASGEPPLEPDNFVG
jgi:hypothetical protein